MSYRIDKDELLRVAEGRWHDILRELAPKVLSDKPHKHRPCPVHGGKDGFRLFKDYELNGGGCCNTCGYFKSGISLLMWANQWDFKETLEAIAESIGFEGGVTHAPRRTPIREPVVDEESIQRKRESLKRVWSGAVTLDHRDAEPVRLYLLRRRLEFLGLPRSLRCHPALGYYHEGKHIGDFPALVAAIVGPEGDSRSIHRTYLDKFGNKAAVPGEPKKVMSPPDDRTILGGSVWLHEKCATSPVAAVTEGIETGLAVQEATGVPTFAAISAGGMAEWRPPAHVRMVLIFADKDRTIHTPHGDKTPGADAARKLLQRMWESGRICRAYAPKGDIPEGCKSLDWADVYASLGKAGFPVINPREIARQARRA